MQTKPELIIIGAGLSGLYAAHLLQSHFSITILEARERIGGRILTQDGHDLGPSWIWPHQHHIHALIKMLGVEIFDQYTHGNALYDSPQGPQRFNPPPSVPSKRIAGGIQTLISALRATLIDVDIILQAEVYSLSLEHDRIELNSSQAMYSADYVLNTLPPRLAAQNLQYHPPLPASVQLKLSSTPTWMGYSAKCLMEFTTPFWREQGLSGFVYSPLGPLSEIHDACTEHQAALFGFVHAKASRQNIQTDIKTQIQRLFPSDYTQMGKFHIMDWTAEKFSSVAEDHKGLSSHPLYGLTLEHFDHRLLFMGTECSDKEGGYLEGAIISAKEAAQKLLGSVVL